jgi:hypothetical protein
MRKLGLILVLSGFVVACGEEGRKGGDGDGGGSGSTSGGTSGSNAGARGGTQNAAGGMAPGSGGKSGAGTGGAAGRVSGGTAGNGAGGSTGGAGSSAGADAGRGGAGSVAGAGGSSSSVSVSEVRCFDSVSSAFEYCFGKIGDLWTMVGPPCTPAEIEADATPISGGPYQNHCAGAADDLGDFQEVRCWSLEGRELPICIFRTGDYWLEGFAACNGVFETGADLTPAAGNDPGALFCGAASGVDGWDQVSCYDEIGFGPCYGRLGSYWFGPAYQGFWISGLYPDCYFDQIANDPEWVEIPWAQADCQ